LCKDGIVLLPILIDLPFASIISFGFPEIFQRIATTVKYGFICNDAKLYLLISKI
jgi:hypothetical protein